VWTGLWRHKIILARPLLAWYDEGACPGDDRHAADSQKSRRSATWFLLTPAVRRRGFFYKFLENFAKKVLTYTS
jgi:hypothetical protein